MFNLEDMVVRDEDESRNEDDEDVKPARIGFYRNGDERSNFVRSINHQKSHEVAGGLPRTSNSFVRLSMAIRRSLRLPVRRSESRLARDREEEEWKANAHVLDTGEPFTIYTRDLKIGPSSVPDRLEEIKENKRLNRPEKLKKILRKTDWPIRHEVRRELWKVLCMNKDFDSSVALYRSELPHVARVQDKSAVFMKDDTSINNALLLSKDGSFVVMKIMLVIERLRPELTSAPMLYPLCTYFLHFMEHEDAFACMMYLLNSRGFMLTSLIEWRASNHTIIALLKKHKPNAYLFLKRRVGASDDDALAKCCNHWLVWLFNGLPKPYTCRLIDCLLVEGKKFLVRSTIALIYIWAKQNKNLNMEDISGMSLDEKIEYVQEELLEFSRKIPVSTDTFITTAVKIRNLQTSTIQRFQAQFEQKIREDGTTTREAAAKRVIRIYTDPFTSSIIDSDSAMELMYSFPPRLQLSTPTRVYQLSQDGASFTQMWSKVDSCDQSLFIFRSTAGDVFGAFVSASWGERRDRKERTKSKYWGTGESFVFNMDEMAGLPKIYHWVGNGSEHSELCPQFFMTASDKEIVIGSGGGDAIRIIEELTHGMSSASETFGSPSLVKTDNAFEIHELEVFNVATCP